MPDTVEEELYTADGPVITGIYPGSASAGTNSHITISGSGFGSDPGNVFFFYSSSRPDTEGNVLSWSDTDIVVDVPAGIINGSYASASSGPESNNYPFEVTFSYGGMKWPGEKPVVSYKINPNTEDCAGEETAVQTAASTWNAVPNKRFTFSYAGATDVTSVTHNYINEIIWTDMGSTATLAQASSWYNPSTNTITESDMKFNDYYDWCANSVPGYSQVDIESVALHELGHFLKLLDLYGDQYGYPQDTGKVMYGRISSGVTRRNLHDSDLSGIRWIYPGVITGPVVQTNEASVVLVTSATLNGEIIDTGGENCDQVKFQYRIQGAGEWTDTGIINGSFGEGIFRYGLGGLTPGTNYEYKAMAHNSAGWSVGTPVSFTTAAPEIYFEEIITSTSSAINIQGAGEFVLEAKIIGLPEGQTVAGFHHLMNFDPALLEVVKVEIPENSLLKQPLTIPTFVYDNLNGTVELVSERSDSTYPGSGGVVYNITMRGKGNGTSPLTHATALFFDALGSEIPLKKVDGQVSLEIETGIAGSFIWQVTPESADIPQAEVSLWAAGADRSTAQPILTRMVSVDPEGGFQLIELPPGSYDITFKLPYSLRTVASNVTITLGALTPADFGEINVGDTWGSADEPDNIIDVSDYAAIIYSFGSVQGDESYIDTCDLNRDGIIDVTDYAIVLYNFGKVGEVPL